MRILDQIDKDILTLLEENAKSSVIAIARQLGCPPSTVRDRIRRLEEDRVILGYKTILNHAELGYGINAIVQVTRERPIPIETTVADIIEFPEVTNVRFVTGEVDELITIYARDMEHLRDILFTKFGTLSWSSRYNTMLILHERSFPFMRNLNQPAEDSE